jgi:hypothetical protein
MCEGTACFSSLVAFLPVAAYHITTCPSPRRSLNKTKEAWSHSAFYTTGTMDARWTLDGRSMDARWTLRWTLSFHWRFVHFVI